MSDAFNEGMAPSSAGTWDAGEPEFSPRDGGRVTAQVADWHDLGAPLQSGLRYSWADGLPVLPRNAIGRRFNFTLKRALDLAGAASLIVVTGPVLLGIAAAVRLTTSGPALFRQDRVGRSGRLFKVLKFRTMYVDQGDHSGVAQTVAADPRVTRIGRFLRRSSLDELPQLFNVLRGDMSLVGPRPQVQGQLAAGMAYSAVIPYYDLRHVVKPGITGWAQVNGFRGPTDTIAKARGRVDHDLAYIQNFSVVLDIKILLLTVWREFVTGSGL